MYPIMMLNYYCFIVVIFSSVLIDFSKTYKILTLEDPTLCSPIVKRRIKLGSESQSGLIVSLNRLKDHTLDWDKNFFCKFELDSSGGRTFAVIQNLTFRRNGITNECIDYIHFKRADGSISEKYCGNISAATDMDPRYIDAVFDKYKPTTNSFDDYTGKLDVNIHIAKEALRYMEPMELNIAFTSYRPCYDPLAEDYDCGDNYTHNCIYKGFIKDGYINCPYFNCTDEDGCSEKTQNEDHKKSVGNKVIISTVTVLFITFVVFVCFVWLCRKYQKLCWSEPFSTSDNIRTQMPTTIFELDQHIVPQCIPATVERTVSVEEDKDLPPAYDTLFPNR